MFQVQLLCLSLHIEVLSFEDSEWSRVRYQMKCQVKKLERFRHILLFEFNRGAEAVNTARNICVVYGDNAIGANTARKWFSRIKDDRFDISDTPRSGRTSGFDEDRLKVLIHNDLRKCSRELINVINCDNSTIVRHLYSNGKVQKSGVWVPHALRQKHRNQLGGHLCISACRELDNFFECIIEDPRLNFNNIDVTTCNIPY